MLKHDGNICTVWNALQYSNVLSCPKNNRVIIITIVSVHVPRPLLRGDEDSRGGVPAAGDRGGQERDGGVVRAGPVDMSGGPGVHGRVGLLSHVLQAHAAGHGVHGTVSELGGDTAAAGEGVQDEPVSVYRQVGGRVSAQ